MADPNVSTAELIAGKDWDGLAYRLCDLSYVQSRVDSGGVFDLIVEFDAAVAAIPPDHSSLRILPVLANSLRRNATFISKHPSATFQCFWNSCWWHDCRDRVDFAATVRGGAAATVGGPQEGGPVSRLMESWRSHEVAKASPWIRNSFPPSLPLDGSLRLEIRLGDDAGQPEAVCLSEERLVVWFRQGKKRVKPRVWNGQTGEPIPKIDVKAFPYCDPSLSPDKKLQVSVDDKDGGWGEPVRVSERRTGSSVASFPIDEDHNITAVAFSADGNLLAAGGYGVDFGGFIYIWDLRSKSLWRLLDLEWAVYSVAFSPNSAEIVAGCSHGCIEIRPLGDGRAGASITAHDDLVVAAQFSSDGQLVASISCDGTLRVWSRTASELSIMKFAPHPDDVIEAKFSPSGDRLVTRSSNGTSWLWNGNTGRPIKCLYQSSGVVQMGGDSRTCIFAGNHMIVSLADGGGVWKSSDGERLADVADRAYLHQSITFTSDGKRFALWDKQSDTPAIITIHDVTVTDLHSIEMQLDLPDEPDGRDGRFVATMTEDGEIRIRRVPERVELARIQAHGADVTRCVFSADNTFLAAASSDGMVTVWVWETGAEVASTMVSPLHPQQPADSTQPDLPRILNVKFIGDHTIAILVERGQILVWDLRNGQVERVPWPGAFSAYPRHMRYHAESRGDEICILDTDKDEEIAWLPCGRDLTSGIGIIAHPNGRTWAGMLGTRVFHFVLEPMPAPESADAQVFTD